MVCRACGRNSANENANYCEYCGTSFRENITFKQENYSAVREQPAMEVNQDENDKPISFGDWMRTMLLPFIPVIGIFIYVVMMFVWAFGNDVPQSKKNWARASLIVTVGIIILFCIIFVTTTMDIINSGMNINDYMNEFY